MKWTNHLVKWLALGAAVTATGAAGTGCLSRPVGQQPPTTKVNFTSEVSQQQVDKVDLLLMIDNSASMGDKQKILQDAVPELLSGLLRPRCVNAAGAPVGDNVADPNGNRGNRFGCPENSEPEFAPVTDMHIGLISSSLGSFGGDVCPDATPRYNDKAHLLNIVQQGGEVAEAKPSNFLSWYPSNEANSDKNRHPDPPTTAITDVNALQSAFQKLVVGVDQTGCGLEAQLESFYRFLIQPDPWVKVSVDPNTNQADLGGPGDIDVDLLRQRADFLRPDSLVAIIMLTDEDDSSADPLSVGGQGWAFMSTKFPGSTVFRSDQRSTTAPRATSACAQNPGSPDCTSCGFAATCNAADPACQKIKNDPECQKNGGYYAADQDSLNVRFHRMKERFGIDPQYPIRRYIDGLTKTKVPDRSVEHVQKARADGKGKDIGGYQSVGKCTNPLFAAKLPTKPGEEICNLPASRTRGPELVFFAVVGGVPNQLLYKDLTDPVGSRVTPVDWNSILGRDPTNFNYEGIDPHMIQSVSPRAGLPGPSGTRGENGSDPIHGREWDTDGDDLQYACTFDLPEPQTNTRESDDCFGGKNPPLCGAAAKQQVKAKAYPTVREFQVVRALGDQGIIASLCPITLKGDKKAPTYGYNPAVQAIIDRLKNALTTQCLPQPLTRDTVSTDPKERNSVPCLVLAQLAEGDSCQKQGLPKPAAEILSKFLEEQKARAGSEGDAGSDVTKLDVCELPQIVVADGQSCKDDATKGWCYVTGAAAGKCPQALLFSASTASLAGAKFSLQCINQFQAGQASGDQPAQ